MKQILNHTKFLVLGIEPTKLEKIHFVHALIGGMQYAQSIKAYVRGGDVVYELLGMRKPTVENITWLIEHNYDNCNCMVYIKTDGCYLCVITVDLCELKLVFAEETLIELTATYELEQGFVLGDILERACFMASYLETGCFETHRHSKKDIRSILPKQLIDNTYLPTEYFPAKSVSLVNNGYKSYSLIYYYFNGNYFFYLRADILKDHLPAVFDNYDIKEHIRMPQTSIERFILNN